jgi:hypothetical protein
VEPRAHNAPPLPLDERQDRQHPVPEDMRFQHRTWIVERVSWLALGLLVCVALAGLFGQGPLSRATASTGEQGIAVDYERFQRITRIARFEIRMAPFDSQDATLRLSRQFQESYEVSSIQPWPLRSTAGPETLELAFARPASGDLLVTIWAHPRRYGLMRVQASGDRGGPVQLPIIVYP